MTKIEKIRLLAQAIVMLETSYTNEHKEVFELAKQIAFLADGNPNLCVLCTIGQKPEIVHEEVNKALTQDLGISLGEYKPF